MNNIVQLIDKEKITFRSRNLINKSLLPELIDTIEKLDYKLYVHDGNSVTTLEKTFTIIIVSHGNNINYFKQSIGSVLKQTICNFELILVDHGCEPELKNLIRESFISDNRIKLLIFDKNLHNPKQTNFLEDRLFNLINAAIFCSKGDYCFFLSYDDMLSNNYVECMLKLFSENEGCVVAAPNIASINEFSENNEIVTNSLRKGKLEMKYMKGLELAISTINGANLFGPPGSLFCFRTNVVLENGGLDCTNDLSQLYKYALLGDVGTDNNACLFWRHHSNQTNKQNAILGALYYGVYSSWFKHICNFLIEKNFPESYQILFKIHMIKIIKESTLGCIKQSIRTGLIGAVSVFLSVIKEAPPKYVLHYIKIFIMTLPWLLYNSLPMRMKDFYRSLKNFVFGAFKKKIQ